MTKKDERSPSFVAGRRPKDPMKKIGWPVRFLVTVPVMELLEEVQKKLDVEFMADVQRLALYEFLSRRGELTLEISQDPTWDNLRRAGLV